MSLLADLIGKECRAEFEGDVLHWPFQGAPAWVVVLDADMPLVKLKSKWGGESKWVNANRISSIASVDQTPKVTQAEHLVKGFPYG